jgi:catechol 2,3-dioxygenase
VSTERPNAPLTHFGIFVRDMPAMVDFYTRVIGLLVTDTGVLRGRPLTFLSRSPHEHHQVVPRGRNSPSGD